MRRGATGGPSAGIRIEVLGPLRLFVDGRAVEVPGPKRRALLALLARAEGRNVAVDDLFDALWPSAPPENARGTLHSHISRLRGHLGRHASRLEAVGGGYRLLLDDDGLDAGQARGCLAEARTLAAGDAAAAHALLLAARGLWRGPALADLRDVEPLAAWAVALDELRRDVGDRLIACALDARQLDGVVALAAEAVAEDPLREPAVVLLMRALAATDRLPDALRTGYDYRRRLAAEAGLDPSPALDALERELAAAAGARSSGPSGALPQPASRLIGREAEIAALQRLVAAERLVTVVGAGGVGKTRVALEVARRADAATVLLLAPVTDPGALPHALAAALDLRVPAGDVLTACAALLGAGPQLLVVDNCEHLLSAAHTLVDALLDACTDLAVLTTSREPLGHPAEALFRLAPLPVPDLRRSAGLERVASVAVFVDRARRVRAGFSPDASELRIVGDIVRRLDGLPIAIELAASRLSAFGLADLHARLDSALDLLGEARADPRHRTLRTTLEWSYDLLPGHEQRLFRHLSVFPDGFDLATAEWVAGDLGVASEPAAALAHLVDASMVEAHLEDEPRYRMLDTLRSFGLDRLAAEREDAEATDRLLRWAVSLAAWVQATATTDSEPLADAALRREVGNLRAAWRLLRQHGRLDDALAVVAGLIDASGWRDLPEIWSWAQELAEDPALKGHPGFAAALGAAALTGWMHGDADRAERLARQGLEAATDDQARCWCFTALGAIAMFRGDTAAAIQHCLAAADCATYQHESLGIAGLAAAYAGKFEQARALHRRLTTLADYPSLAAFGAYVGGEIDSACGRPDAAQGHYTQAIDLARAAGVSFVEGIASVGLLTVLAALGRTDEALRGYRDLVGYWERTGSWIQQWTTLRNLARLLRTLGEHEAALFLEAAADSAADAPAVGDTVWPSPAPDSAAALPARTVTRIRSEAAACPRAHVLAVVRDTISRHLPTHTPAG